jgi:hypothetical protein
MEREPNFRRVKVTDEEITAMALDGLVPEGDPEYQKLLREVAKQEQEEEK